MSYRVLLTGLSDDVEGDIEVSFQGKKIVCFVNHVGHSLTIGENYDVEFSPVIFDEYDVEEIPEGTADCGLFFEGGAFACRVVGKLVGGCVDSGQVILCDEFLAEEFGWLCGRTVSWRVDRLDVTFL